MMALAFPLSAATFWNILPMKALKFDIPDETTYARTKGGEILPADAGVSLWTARVTLDRMEAHELAQVRPLLDLLRRGGSFMMWDRTRPGPAADPRGAILGTAKPVISSLPNPREITVSGLPPGYVIARDDMIAFSYGTDPVRFALHQVVTGSAANSGGVTGAIEVVPPIRPGAATGAAVTLMAPPCKAVLVPKTLERDDTRAGFITDSLTFSAQQTLR